MSSKERILDDMAKIAGGAVNILSGVGHQVRSDLKSRIDDAAMKLDLVPREDFERLESLITEYRIKQEEILTRLDALEEKAKKGKK